jgi:Pacifastin inhibitor (LCMII)/Kazal-type serine protease inhibitor domain
MDLSNSSKAVLVAVVLVAGCRVEARSVQSDGARPAAGDGAKPGAPCSAGATAPAADGCNTCSCANGVWACTEKLCPKDPGKEPSPERNCGGIAGFQCPPNTYCAYGPTQKCGAGDQMAACKPRPEVCTKEYKPVCGCNGKDYGNVCEAAHDGTSVLKEGSCK